MRDISSEINDPDVWKIINLARMGKITSGEAVVKMEELYDVKTPKMPGLNETINLSEGYRAMKESGLSSEEYFRRAGVINAAMQLFWNERVHERHAHSERVYSFPVV